MKLCKHIECAHTQEAARAGGSFVPRLTNTAAGLRRGLKSISLPEAARVHIWCNFKRFEWRRWGRGEQVTAEELRVTTRRGRTVEEMDRG